MNKEQHYVVWIANLIICGVIGYYAIDHHKELLLLVPVILFSGLLFFSLMTESVKTIAKQAILHFFIVAAIGTSIATGIKWYKEKKRKQRTAYYNELCNVLSNELSEKKIQEESNVTETWKYLELGMTENEVISVLGEPESTSNSELIGATWYYSGARSISFNTKGKVRSWHGF